MDDFFAKMMNIDRRVIYVLVALTVIVPMFIPIGLPISVTHEVRTIYDYIESLKPGQTVFVAIDYDPTTMAENHPQAMTVLRQCFSRNLNVIVTALSQNGPGMAELLISQVAREYDKKNGVHYAFLGYKPFPAIVIRSMGENFRISFPEDYYGTPLDSLPLMRNKKNYDDVALVVAVEAGWVAETWVGFAHEVYKVPVALAVTAVNAAQYYPYLNAGQIVGLMAGLKGAAEYESLFNYAGAATKGMDVQSIAHLVIILLIVIGNIGYFSTRRKGPGQPS